MGNIESGPEGSLGPVDSLKHRLQSLEETIRSIEVGATTPTKFAKKLLLDKIRLEYLYLVLYHCAVKGTAIITPYQPTEVSPKGPN